MILKTVIYILFICISAFATMNQMQTWQPIVPNIVKDKFSTVQQEKLEGLLGTRVDINLEKRLLKIDSAILLSGFKKRPGSQTWIGEHVGKFLFSAALTYKHSRDPRLKQLMDEMAAKYISYQLYDGYMGTYLPKDYWSEWDVWAHKYCIIGLLNYYSITGSQPALECAKKAADLICKTFGDASGQMDLMKSGHHMGMAAGSILEPMVDLYRYTGDIKYLDFCNYILRAWEQSNGPKIISNLEKYGKVTKVGNAKAYEMLSCLVGIAKYYKLTGEEKYYKALQTAWIDIRLNKMYITGTASSFEHFKEDNILPAGNDDHMGEGCVTTTWLQLNHQLFMISGEQKYMEEVERAVYNHLFAAENPITGCVSYYTALQGVKPHKCDQGFSCCLSSIPRGISMVPDLVWGKVNGIFSVLMYDSGEVIDSIKATDGSTLKLGIKSESKFPYEGGLKYTINPSSAKKFALNFRVPAWCTNFTASVNGQIYKGIVGSFLSIERDWKPVDVVIINFDIPVQIIPGGISYPNQIAIKRGPQVLAIDAILNPSLKNLAPITCETNEVILTNSAESLPVGWAWKQAYAATLKVDGKPQKIIFVPFADAGQNASEIGVWINQPKLNFK